MIALLPAHPKYTLRLHLNVSAWLPHCSRSATPPSSSGFRRTWSECDSAAITGRAKNQAVAICKERILRLLGPLSQGDQYFYLWHWGPIGMPGYGSPHFTMLHAVPFPESKAFPSVCVILWVLPCIHTDMSPHPRNGGKKKGENYGKRILKFITALLGLNFLSIRKELGTQ